jgi:hypothetical protein
VFLFLLYLDCRRWCWGKFKHRGWQGASREHGRDQAALEGYIYKKAKIRRGIARFGKPAAKLPVSCQIAEERKRTQGQGKGGLGIAEVRKKKYLPKKKKKESSDESLFH